MDIFEDTTSFFEQVKDGMEVFDLYTEKVGTIKHFQFPNAADEIDVHDFPYNMANTTIHPEAVYRLLRSGFFCVEGGLLAHDRIITPDQIAIIADGKMFLNVKQEKLLTV